MEKKRYLFCKNGPFLIVWGLELYGMTESMIKKDLLKDVRTEHDSIRRFIYGNLCGM